MDIPLFYCCQTWLRTCTLVPEYIAYLWANQATRQRARLWQYTANLPKWIGESGRERGREKETELKLGQTTNQAGSLIWLIASCGATSSNDFTPGVQLPQPPLQLPVAPPMSGHDDRPWSVISVPRVLYYMTTTTTTTTRLAMEFTT